MAAYGQVPVQPAHASVNFGRLSLQSLQQYVEEHRLDVRPGASVHELTVAAAQHFDYLLDVDEDYVLSRFVNVAKRGPDDRSRAVAAAPAAAGGSKRRRPGLPEPGDTEPGSYSAPDVYGGELDAGEAAHAAKAQAMGHMAAQQGYMYDMHGGMVPAQAPAQRWGAGAGYGGHPHAAAGHGMMGMHPHGGHGAGLAPGSDKQEDDTLYCICQRPSFGQMIGCDAKDCPFEWFHVSCVQLPEGYEVSGKWYCPECRAAPAEHARLAPAKLRKQRKLDRMQGRRAPGGEEFAQYPPAVHYPHQQ